MSDFCNLCGQLTDGLNLKPGRCLAGIDYNTGAVQRCDGTGIAASGPEIVRDAMRSPKLREALAEALDILENGYQYFGSPEQAKASLKARIAELRKLTKP